MSTTSGIRLREHQASEHALSADVARAIASHPDAQVTVLPGSDGTWSLKPGAVVGTFVAAGTRVTVVPKIPIPNVLHLMGCLPSEQHWNRAVLGFAEEPTLTAALAQLLRIGLDRALATGPRHTYVEHADDIAGIRGRIDFGALACRTRSTASLPCRFDEYTPDNALNRLLLVAATVALTIPDVAHSERLRLRGAVALLEEAGVTFDPGSVQATERWEPSHLDRHYELAVVVARIIATHASISHEAGRARSATFLIDMNRLVERFLTTELAKRVQGVFRLDSQVEEPLSIDGRIRVRPDLVVWHEGRQILVADIKYKDARSIDDLAMEDVYQIATYTRMYGMGTGLIISAGQVGASDQFDATLLRSDGMNLEIWPVDLTLPPKELDRRLDHLAERLMMTPETVATSDEIRADWMPSRY